MPVSDPIKTAREALMRAVLNLRHNPTPDERRETIAQCEVAIEALVLVQTAKQIQSKGGASDSDAKKAAARENGKKGGRPRKTDT